VSYTITYFLYSSSGNRGFCFDLSLTNLINYMPNEEVKLDWEIEFEKAIQGWADDGDAESSLIPIVKGFIVVLVLKHKEEMRRLVERIPDDAQFGFNPEKLKQRLKDEFKI